MPGWPPVREHDVTALTVAELKLARRELAASLAMARPGSRALVPIRAQNARDLVGAAGTGDRGTARKGDATGASGPVSVSGVASATGHRCPRLCCSDGPRGAVSADLLRWAPR